MIRFSCPKCGKSLRADESIVGRSTRCTACNSINRVPVESTRKSGEKQKVSAVVEDVAVDNQDDDILSEEIVTLLADSDSFDKFDDFDFSSLKLDPSTAKSSNSVSSKLSTASNAALDRSSELVNHGQTEGQAESPSHRRWHSEPASHGQAVGGTSMAGSRPSMLKPLAAGKLRDFPSPSVKKLGILAAGILILLVVGYFLFRFLFGQSSFATKTDFENSPIGQHYAHVLQELKKSVRVMEYMERGYHDKKLPESGLSSINEFKKEYRTFIDDKAALKEANQQFASGGEPAARKFVRERIEKMKEMKNAAERHAAWLRKEVYPNLD